MGVKYGGESKVNSLSPNFVCFTSRGNGLKEKILQSSFIFNFPQFQPSQFPQIHFSSDENLNSSTDFQQISESEGECKVSIWTSSTETEKPWIDSA